MQGLQGLPGSDEERTFFESVLTLRRPGRFLGDHRSNNTQCAFRANAIRDPFGPLQDLLVPMTDSRSGTSCCLNMSIHYSGMTSRSCQMSFGKSWTCSRARLHFLRAAVRLAVAVISTQSASISDVCACLRRCNAHAFCRCWHRRHGWLRCTSFNSEFLSFHLGFWMCLQRFVSVWCEKAWALTRGPEDPYSDQTPHLCNSSRQTQLQQKLNQSQKPHCVLMALVSNALLVLSYLPMMMYPKN